MTTSNVNKAKMQNLILTQSTNMLKEIAKGLMNNHTDEANITMELVLNELENRISESEFIEFCNSL